MTADEIGKKLVALLQNGRTLEALDTLYAPDVVSVEAQESPSLPRVMEGLAAVRGKNEWWYANHEVHRAEMKGPFPHGDRFALYFDYDVTAKAGPMSGQRMQMQEVALYTVADGRIVREEFFYSV
ncbi:MAG: nuclear transport factor 2 family protein [Vicinamibacteria bacterium]